MKIDKLKNYLFLNNNVLFGYLFGSYSKNEQTISSDIDIALYLKDTSLDNKLQINYELSKLLRKDVDLVILNEIKNIYLLDDILRNSNIIKDDDERVDFELIKEHEILDYKAFRRYIDDIQKQKTL